MSRGLVVSALVLLLASTAAAHNGASPSVARFSAPPAPVVAPVGDDLVVSPYAFASADTSYHVEFTDDDTDPTGHFTFYHLNHAPSSQLQPDDVERFAEPVREVGGGAGPVSIWAGCTCANDLGLACLEDGGARDCRNGFDWDTSGLPPGAYWILAVNNDPPFRLYSVSGGPVRVAHGGPLPPAAVVVKPDGYGAWDKAYRTQWIMTGAPPIKVDLAYGVDEVGRVLGPVTSLAKGVTPTTNSDGSLSWDWDVSALPGERSYFLRVTVTDATGLSTFTDSRFSLGVYHPPSDGGVIFPFDAGPDDAGVAPPKKGGCAVEPGERMGATGAALLALGLAAALALLARRRGR